MGFLDKAKAAAEQAAAKAKEGVEDVQAKRELGAAYNELGKAAYDLADGGELSHPGLDALVDKVRKAKERAEGDGDGELVGATAGTTAASDDPDTPPAMPT